MVRFNIATAVIFFCAMPTTAQNLLVNPGFDTVDQLDGWTCLGASGANGMASWSSEDRSESPTSGSMMLDVAAASTNKWMRCEQCIPVNALSSYLMFGWYFFPSDPDVSQVGSVRWSFAYYSDLSCTTYSAAGGFALGYAYLDTWRDLATEEITAPAGSVAAKVSFVAWQDNANQPVRTRMDDLAFGTLLIFQDGFESGGVGTWSSSVP